MSLHVFVGAFGTLYESQVPAFVQSLQKSNPGCSIEILVNDPEQMIQKQPSLNSSDILLRKVSKDLLAKGLSKMEYGSYRFLEEPQIKKDQTYICDVDIFHCEEILPKLITTWPKEVPQHNMLRKIYIKLTGVMCVKTYEYYIDAWRQARDTILKGHRHNDEIQLTMLVNLVWTPLPTWQTYRPIFGLHLSPNRGPTKVIPNVTTPEYMSIIESYIQEKPEFFGQFLKDIALVKIASE